MMGKKYLIAVFVIVFTGMCGLVAVDQNCNRITGEGGCIGLQFDKTADGSTAFCFFGIEGEIGR